MERLFARKINKLASFVVIVLAFWNFQGANIPALSQIKLPATDLNLNFDMDLGFDFGFEKLIYPLQEWFSPKNSVVSLTDFESTVVNGDPNTIVGVYRESEFAQRVIQQPADDPTFVPPYDNVIAQFGLPAEYYGNIAFLAHNYLSGEYFYELQVGEVVQVIYGDGSIEEFMITEIHNYKALSPDDVESDYFNLKDNQEYSSEQVFNDMFGGNYHITFQTCIAHEDEASWGRMFVIGVPIG